MRKVYWRASSVVGESVRPGKRIVGWVVGAINDSPKVEKPSNEDGSGGSDVDGNLCHW
jgi:hypothetical protein